MPRLQASGKKIGRPLTDSGNPDEPGLRDDERRRIRRRMANRESARRVRERRIESKAKMEAKVRPTLMMKFGGNSTLDHSGRKI